MADSFRTLAIAALVLQLLPAAAVGQQRTYTVSWLGIPIVDVGVSLKENTGGTDATYSAKTRGWFDPIYSVDNRYEVHIPRGEAAPTSYHKWIIEKGVRDSLAATYRVDKGETIYSNGIIRQWNQGDHNLFSALLWVEGRKWTKGEHHNLSVEVEGVTWEVQAECYEVVTDPDSLPEYLLLATFLSVIRGEPVLSSTDMVTHMLPGIGHKLRLSLDSKRMQILWIELGRAPFIVRARLNEENI